VSIRDFVKKSDPKLVSGSVNEMEMCFYYFFVVIVYILCLIWLRINILGYGLQYRLFLL